MIYLFIIIFLTIRVWIYDFHNNTNVDTAETDKVMRELPKAVENLAFTMKTVDGLLVHIPTDYVFGSDPHNTPCKENQKGTPTGGKR